MVRDFLHCCFAFLYYYFAKVFVVKHCDAYTTHKECDQKFEISQIEKI